MVFRSSIFFVLILLVDNIVAQAVQKNQLVTMTKQELLRIVECIGSSTNQSLCDEFQVCNRKMPKKVLEFYEVCNKKLNPNGRFRCNVSERLFSSESIPRKIFDCIASSIQMLSAEESKKMMEFENCSRGLYVMANCTATLKENHQP